MENVASERRHAHSGGSIIATVAGDADGNECYAAWLQCRPPDGRSLLIRIYEDTWGVYESVEAAQRALDVEVRRLIGHECSESCEPWPQVVRH